MKKIEDNNTLVFLVDARATKKQIKDAVKRVRHHLRQGEHAHPPRRRQEGVRAPRRRLRRPRRRQQDRHHLIASAILVARIDGRVRGCSPVAYSVSRVFWVRLGCDNKQYPRPTTLRTDAAKNAKSIFAIFTLVSRPCFAILSSRHARVRSSFDRPTRGLRVLSIDGPLLRFRLKPPPAPPIASRALAVSCRSPRARTARAVARDVLAARAARRAPEAKRASRARRGRAPRASSPRVASARSRVARSARRRAPSRKHATLETAPRRTRARRLRPRALRRARRRERRRDSARARGRAARARIAPGRARGRARPRPADEKTTNLLVDPAARFAAETRGASSLTSPPPPPPRSPSSLGSHRRASSARGAPRPSERACRARGGLGCRRRAGVGCASPRCSRRRGPTPAMSSVGSAASP